MAARRSVAAILNEIRAALSMKYRQRIWSSTATVLVIGHQGLLKPKTGGEAICPGARRAVMADGARTKTTTQCEIDFDMIDEEDAIRTAEVGNHLPH